jgi:ATP-dependent Zn protease
VICKLEMEKTLEASAAWEPCEDEQGVVALRRLAGHAPQFFADATLVSARSLALPFYATHRLIELHFVRDHGTERAFALDGADDTLWLNGDSDPIHEANGAAPLLLTDATVKDYVRFFLYFLRADMGAFVLVESPDEIVARDDNGGTPTVAEVRGRVVPLTMQATEDADRWVLHGSVAYNDHLFMATFAVGSDGDVEMIDDEPVETLAHVSVPEYPSLELADASLEWRPPEEPGELPRDREVTEALVEVLLEDAFQKLEGDAPDGNLLLRHFNLETQGEKPIAGLKRLVEHSLPVIIIESDIPFVEDFVAGLIAPDRVATGAVEKAGALANQFDDTRCAVDLQDGMVELHLLSFHAYRGLFDAERTAHELALRDVAVLIGCERSADVPEPLRRMADLVLTFPRIDRRLFARIFERVFHAKPAPGWDSANADWTRYLVPADFHTPRRVSVNPTEALSMLKERVEARLRRVTPDVGPRLSELHGLGEARQICEDLMVDVRAAQTGQIPWAVVDKGLLLVGAPGTGKTTLARAIAKECGIKFVIASAAKWQAAGALDAHLGAMRADFAEARRYAPAILFIDELDSIGSREQVSGPNAQYHTEVINALLEQIQGITTVDSVIVIGATNHLAKVDPALQRAGRLDQVVQIPLPNIESLKQIFAYYLARYRADGGQIAGNVDEQTLAELAFGLTGADVEFFVRGAARRARKENRAMSQADLAAEVTRRPRRPDSAPPVGPAEMRRTAVHEAGHTVARLISSTGGEDLTFVSIIPRMDGSLGFVASVPRDGHVETRRTMLERLETVLAGRAAEEVVYGADEVGVGAGGPEKNSDLAVATRLATMIVCQTGLGADGSLHWTEQPTPAQETQIGTLLGTAYSSILARLQGQRPLLDRIVAVLEAKQELSGAELRGLLTRSADTRALPT